MERYTQALESKNYGIEAKDVSFNWETYKKFSQKVTADLRKGVELLLKSRKVDVFNGEAKFLTLIPENSYSLSDKGTTSF